MAGKTKSFEHQHARKQRVMYHSALLVRRSTSSVDNENVVELATQVFDTLLKVTVLTERWRTDYNHVKSRSALDYYPPVPQARVSISLEQPKGRVCVVSHGNPALALTRSTILWTSKRYRHLPGCLSGRIKYPLSLR